MKQLLVIAIALASVNAFASRARFNALGNAVQLIDTQTVLSNPADMMFIGDYANFESGTTAGVAPVTPTGTNIAPAYQSNAEGTITRSFGNSKFGLTLGFQSKNASIYTNGTTGTPGLRYAASALFLRDKFIKSSFLTDAQNDTVATSLGLGVVDTAIPTNNTVGIKGQQNPLNVHYGTKIDDWAVAGTLVYSNYNNKATSEKESSSGIRLGARNDTWDAKVGIGLNNTYETTSAKFNGTAGYSAGVGYKMDDLYFNANFEMAGFKLEKSGVEKVKLDYTAIALAAVKLHKTEGGNLFYGVTLAQDERKFKLGQVPVFIPNGLDIKQTALTLPIIFGFEADAASWLTLRGSVSQRVLINTSKVEAGSATAEEFAPGVNITVASIGAGLKFNSLTVDGSLQGLTGENQTQELNGNTLLGQVGFTYLF